MKHRLYIKLLLGYLIYGILSFAVLFTFTQDSTQRTQTRLQAQKAYREAAQIARYVEQYYSNVVSLDEVQEHLSIIGSALSSDLWVVDSSGKLLLDTDDPSVFLRAKLGNYDQVEGFSVDDFGDRSYMTGRFYNHFQEEMMSAYAPITMGYHVRGYVLIHQPMQEVISDRDQFINVSFFSMGIMFLCAFLILAVFTYTVYIPIRKITRTADSYAKGDFSKKIDVHAGDEIGYLANTLNFMAAELQMREEDQRKFISNVSHDFRSPLTSIKGYIEAMLDGTIPPELQDKYLNIILFETNRLHKLTESLLELNRFGGRGAMLDRKDFDINRTIKTTIMTFEGACKQRGLSFDLVLTGEELFVNGDTAKIQQVLYNLIDNAVKFSHDNTAVTIETSIKNGKVLISVKDSGIGIPADGISKIWDRFYKTDLSRGKDKRGTGLGLSIVKEIVQAHKEHINVVSTEGVGTEFIFTLPLAKDE